MRRIAYILVDKDENIFMDNVTFKSLKKTEKQIAYGIKNAFFVRETWKPKKIVLDGVPKNKNVSQEWREVYSLIFVMGFAICSVFLLMCLQPVVNNIEQSEETRRTSSLFILLSAIGLTYWLRDALKVIKSVFIQIKALYLWMQYRKENTSELEIYSFNDYSKLEKEKIKC